MSLSVVHAGSKEVQIVKREIITNPLLESETESQNVKNKR